MHARGGIGRGQLHVRRVAVRADRGDHQSALEQPLAVDAHGVAGQDVRLGALAALSGLLPVAVAAPAELGHVAREGGRARVVAAQDMMGIVAVGAGRGVAIAHGGSASVDPLAVALHLVGVADGAVHLLRDRGAGPELRRRGSGVALRAGHAAVHRILEPLPVDEERDFAPLARHGQVPVPMAGEAVLVGHALVVEDLARLVRGVAVDADRDLVRLRLPERALDHLAVHLLDQHVALRASGGDVVPVDRGARILRGQHEVRRVAARADRRDGQALLEEPLAVDRLRVVVEDVLVGDVAGLLHRRALLVAGSAGARDVVEGDRGLRVAGRQDLVPSVAEGADRGEFVPLGQRLTVQALAEEPPLRGMA